MNNGFFFKCTNGMERAVIDVLKIRFETITEETVETLKKIESVDTLESILNNAIKADSFSEFNEVLNKV